MWTVDFTAPARKAFGKLERTVQKRITHYLYERVAPNPRQIGDFLTGDKSGLWRYRVGDFRIIVSLQDEKCLVLIVRIGHRKNIYDF